MGSAGRKLTVVVPCHNEQELITPLTEAIKEALAEESVLLEILLVDDGSSDGTLDEMRRCAAADPRVSYLSFSRNFGKESAMLAGLRHATGDAVIIMDADFQHPPALLPEMLRLHEQGHDQVVARRTRTGDRLHRTLASRLYYRSVNRLMDVPLDDGTGDFRLLSRRALDALLALPEANRFSKGLFSWIGFEPAVIDYENAPRASGTTSWRMGSLVNYGIDGIVSFNSRPLRVSLYLGLVISAVSFLYTAWVIGQAMITGVSVRGYTTLVAGVAGLGGVQLIFLGVIGEYIGRIYYESKRRPHYIIRDSNVADPQRAG